MYFMIYLKSFSVDGNTVGVKTDSPFVRMRLRYLEKSQFYGAFLIFFYAYQYMPLIFNHYCRY